MPPTPFTNHSTSQIDAGRRPTILLRSCWAFGNIGDIAITPGMLALLEEHIPEARIVIHPAYAGEASETYLRPAFPSVEWVHGHLGHLHEPESDDVRQAYEQADLFLYNSGPILDHGHAPYDGPVRTSGWRSFDWNYTLHNAAPIYTAMRHGIPWGIWGQEFNYFSPVSQQWARDLLGRASFLYTRETDSLDYLQSLDIEADEMGFVPDSTFAFQLRDTRAADALLARHQLKPGAFLGMNIRSSALAFTNARQEADHMQKLRAVVAAWIDQTALPVLLFPETRVDVKPTRQLIYEAMPARYQANLHCVDRFWMPDEAFAVFHHARAMLMMDHHSVIMSLAAGVPTIHPRVPLAGRKGMVMNDLSLGDWLFDIDQASADDVLGTLMNIHGDYSHAKQRVQSAMQQVRTRHREAMNIVRQTLMTSWRHRQSLSTVHP